MPPRCRPIPRSGSVARGIDQGQRERDPRAAAAALFCPDRSAVPLDQSFRDRQTEAGAPAGCDRRAGSAAPEPLERRARGRPAGCPPPCRPPTPRPNRSSARRPDRHRAVAAACDAAHSRAGSASRARSARARSPRREARPRPCARARSRGRRASALERHSDAWNRTRSLEPRRRAVSRASRPASIRASSNRSSIKHARARAPARCIAGRYCSGCDQRRPRRPRASPGARRAGCGDRGSPRPRAARRASNSSLQLATPSRLKAAPSSASSAGPCSGDTRGEVAARDAPRSTRRTRPGADSSIERATSSAPTDGDRRRGDSRRQRARCQVVPMSNISDAREPATAASGSAPAIERERDQTRRGRLGSRPSAMRREQTGREECRRPRASAVRDHGENR